ncbi:hypothetical protein ABT008_10150 [Micromonospora sp. NPDC002389]|uniref:hypothetical protein n=1 Tax=Micromonospora sp. NPDC002389 TaxID=3154272 RepID=UPI00332EAB26
MRVLFLALGATRRRAVVAESAQVVAEGGSAVVLVESAARWKRVTFADGVDVVAMSKLEQRRPVRRAEKFLLYKGPRFLLNRVIGRGRLQPRARRASKAYERRIADRVHRRIFLPAYGRFFKQDPSKLVERHLVESEPFDLLVVTDALSMPMAVDLLALPGTAGRVAPSVAYSIDYVGG